VNERLDLLQELSLRVGLEPHLTIEELAALANVSRRTIERAIADGRVAVKHLSPRMVRITRSSAAAYLAGVEPPTDMESEPGTLHALTDHLTEGGRP
jgi:excisionase family DNA binding protein